MLIIYFQDEDNFDINNGFKQSARILFDESLNQYDTSTEEIKNKTELNETKNGKNGKNGLF